MEVEEKTSSGSGPPSRASSRTRPSVGLPLSRPRMRRIVGKRSAFEDGVELDDALLEVGPGGDQRIVDLVRAGRSVVPQPDTHLTA